MSTKRISGLITLVCIQFISVFAQNFETFTPVQSTFQNEDLLLPKGFSYTVLFSEGDTVVDIFGKRGPAKGGHDLCIYIPLNDSSNHGYLYVGHETRTSDDFLGDGGGGTLVEVIKNGKSWSVEGTPKAVDFKSLGGSMHNCGGSITPDGKVLTCEESYPRSNADIFFGGRGIRDTSNFKGKPKYQNYGWVVEVDWKSAKATRKLEALGRFEHECVWAMEDGKTLYMTDDETPAIFYKFIADTKGDYTKGKLFAYRQSEDGEGGSWILIPNDYKYLENCNDIAIKSGATMFVRHEWIVQSGKYLYITETGSDEFNLNQSLYLGGHLAKHLREKSDSKGNIKDPYGRVLKLDLESLKMSVFVEGGLMKDSPEACFSNPDALNKVRLSGKDYLVISEDCNGKKYNRVSAGAEARGETYNEVYFIEADDKEHNADDLKRFLCGPRGCETTGDYFTPDGTAYFLNIQHPDSKNQPPFNKSCTVVITRD